MSEWKELKIDNLPSDILIKDHYDFCWIIGGVRESPFRIGRASLNGRINFSSMLITLNNSSNHSLNYKKIHPKAPTHEEIMTKWWEINDGWLKVNRLAYDCHGTPIYFLGEDPFWASEFIGRESADIPPETT